MDNLQTVKRGDVWLIDLGEGKGSEQEGERPCVVISNDLNNIYSPNITILAMTSQLDKAKLPTHVLIEAGQCGVKESSLVLGEQIRTVSKIRLKEKLAELDIYTMKKIERAFAIQTGLVPISIKRHNNVLHNQTVLA